MSTRLTPRSVAALAAIVVTSLAGCSAAAPAAAQPSHPAAGRAATAAPTSGTSFSTPSALPSRATGASSAVPALPATPPPVLTVLPTASAAPATQLVRPLVAAVHPDVLVTGSNVASARRLAALAAPGRVVAYRTGSVLLAGRQVRVSAVDPSAFRAFADPATAASTPVWDTVARGELVVTHELASRLALPLGGQVTLTSHGRAAPMHLGALATTGIPGTELLVDDAAGRRLGLGAQSAVLLAGPAGTDPVALAGRARAAGGAATVDLLTPPARPVALLTGSRAAQSFGSFSYRYFADGTIEPDAAWVRANVRTATLPVVGLVSCHRLMLPQLRGALAEVVAAGLAGTLHTYDGCYVPRFIERNPDRSISLHTWGIAIDLDAATNGRGIRGSMDPRVVTIFKRWGFRWGGDWQYTDPMHFEMGALLTSPAG